MGQLVYILPMRIVFLLFLFSLSVAADCLSSLKQSDFSPERLDFAENFEIYRLENSKLVRVKAMGKIFEYLLYRDRIPSICSSIRKIKVPVKRVVATSTNYIPALLELNVSASLKGFSNIKMISNVERLKNQKIIDVGYPPNTELVLSLRPDLIISYVVQSVELEGIAPLLNLNLPVVFNADFLEKTPLGRAEWIKFIALFYGREQQAGKFFAQIKDRYQTLKRLVSKRSPPRVIVGSDYNGIWNAPGGKSDFAQLLADAGGDYLWKDNSSRDTIRVDFEKVFVLLLKSDFWLCNNHWENRQQVIAQDRRYESMKILDSLYNFNLKLSAGGGNDFWQTGVMRPDLVLEDLISILHPKILPNYQAHWYRKLK